MLAPAVYAEGFHLWIGLPEIDVALRDLPGNACRLVADREVAAVIHMAPDTSPEMLASAWIEPVSSGSSYPFART